MDLAELKEKHPDLVKALLTEAAAPLQAELAAKDQRIADLERSNQQLTDANKDMTGRVAKLEKTEAIRTERELKAQADETFNSIISGFEIPERLHVKIRAQIDHGKFVEDGKLNAEKFTEACKSEIGSWAAELKEAYSGQPKVMGLTSPGGDPNADKQQKIDELADRMIGYIVGSKEEGAN